MKHGKTRLFALAAAHGASLLAVPPVLQAAETGQLEEIVVTARQREERGRSHGSAFVKRERFHEIAHRLKPRAPCAHACGEANATIGVAERLP